jgi:hypothetical protein
MRYDAHKQPDRQAWLELDESERIDLGIDDGLGSFASKHLSPLSNQGRHGPTRSRREGRVEDGRGSLGPMANAPFPIPAHQ